MGLVRHIRQGEASVADLNTEWWRVGCRTEALPRRLPSRLLGAVRARLGLGSHR
jgi:hypothetical protein